MNCLPAAFPPSSRRGHCKAGAGFGRILAAHMRLALSVLVAARRLNDCYCNLHAPAVNEQLPKPLGGFYHEEWRAPAAAQVLPYPAGSQDQEGLARRIML